MPETADLKYIELDILFEKKAKMKKFKLFQVNLANLEYFPLSRTTGLEVFGENTDSLCERV